MIKTRINISSGVEWNNKTSGLGVCMYVFIVYGAGRLGGLEEWKLTFNRSTIPPNLQPPHTATRACIHELSLFVCLEWSSSLYHHCNNSNGCLFVCWLSTRATSIRLLLNKIKLTVKLRSLIPRTDFQNQLYTLFTENVTSKGLNPLSTELLGISLTVW